MANKYHYQNMKGIKKAIFKIADAFKSRGSGAELRGGGRAFYKGGKV